MSDQPEPPQPEVDTGGSSPFILGLHIVMWSNLFLGLLALLVVILLTRH